MMSCDGHMKSKISRLIHTVEYQKVTHTPSTRSTVSHANISWSHDNQLTREISGSEAISLRNRVMAATPSSMPSSMLMSST